MSRSLQKRTIKKLFREHFKGEEPIVAKYDSEKKKLISEIKHKLSTLDGFVLSDSYYARYMQPEDICYFELLSESKKYYSQSFTLTFNAQHELIIEKKSERSPVYHLEQIYTLFEKVTLELKRLDANKSKSQSSRESDQLKREKIKGLKHQAIIGKIHQIAKEQQLEFYVIEFVTKVKLAIRLAESEKLEIDIPYNNFQKILQKLPAMIQTLKEFHELGTTLKMRRTGYRDPKWISYKDEQKTT
jgi:hypothetical protein